MSRAARAQRRLRMSEKSLDPVGALLEAQVEHDHCRSSHTHLNLASCINETLSSTHSSEDVDIGITMSSPQQHAPERSIFGVDPLDDFATMVGDWIYANSRGRQNIEVSKSTSVGAHLRSCSTDDSMIS